MSERFPTLTEYLGGLPEGIESYPQCVAKASLLRAVLDELGGPRSESGLPDALARELAEPSPPSAWIPEVIYVAAHYALQDLTGTSDDEMLEITYRANRKLTESTMYRALAKVATPRILLKGAQVGWKLIHRGVVLRVHSRAGRSEVIVRHPPKLWPATAHRSAALGFRAVIEAAHGKNPQAEVAESRDDGARFELSWG